jgi:hypothetical protein
MDGLFMFHGSIKGRELNTGLNRGYQGKRRVAELWAVQTITELVPPPCSEPLRNVLARRHERCCPALADYSM